MREDLDLKKYASDLEQEANELRSQLYIHKCVSIACIIVLSVTLYVWAIR